jgi:histidinol-phosphatase (PHP family)
MLCHFDLVKKFNRVPTVPLSDRLERILHKIKDGNITLEINTSGVEHPAKEPYPSPDILKRCRRYDIPVTVGSDAHAPKHIGRHFDRAKTLLVDAGYRSLNTFTNREAIPVPL